VDSFGLQNVKGYFATDLMNKSRKPYSIFQKATSIFLMLTLLWLTVSTPFILSMQQDIAKQQKMVSVENPVSDGDEDAANSGNNNIEEKVPNTGNNFSEEFLHEHHSIAHFDIITEHNHELHNSDIYVAYHGELHVPPPNA
jgi:hypothetical protein